MNKEMVKRKLEHMMTGLSRRSSELLKESEMVTGAAAKYCMAQSETLAIKCRALNDFALQIGFSVTWDTTTNSYKLG